MIFNIFLSILILFSTVFFHSNVFTLLLIISVIGLYFFQNKKINEIKYYLISVIIYLILSFINSKYFISNVPGDFNYSFLKEILYIIKYSMPFIFYLSIKDKILSDLPIKIWSSFIFINLTITNLFKLSFSSYSNEIIKGNVFDWFKGSFNYDELATRGFFAYANQISILIVIFLIYFLVFKKNKLFIFMNAFSGMLIATRISVFIPLSLLIIFLFYDLIFDFKNKSFKFKNYIYNVLFIIFFCIMLPYSPQFDRIRDYNLYGFVNGVEVAGNVIYNEYDFKKIYIEENYKELQINEKFIKDSYPYQYDVDFWYDILKLPYEKRIDYRFLETEMVKRVYEINDNKADYLFGIGMSRIFSIWNIENDFVMQFYSFGIIGALIIFFVYFKMLYDFIKHFISIKKLETLFPLAMLTTFFVLSYMSGNILNSLSICFMVQVTIVCLKNRQKA